MSRILFLRADRYACGYYRCELPARRLREEGHHVEVRDELGVVVGGGLVLTIGTNWDAIVWQRPTRAGFSAIAKYLAERTRLYVEIDDALDCMPPDNPCSYWMRAKGESVKYMYAIMRMAYGVIVSTPALAERYVKHNPNIYVCENCVDLREWPAHSEIRKEGTPVLVGWAGSNTHLGDIRELRGWIERPIAEQRAKLRLMGATEYRRQFPDLQDIEIIPWLPIEEYRQKLAELDIGLAPLAENEFNRCKSWLRPLELAACGVPIVASDYGEYSRLLEGSGAGLLVRKKRDWERHVEYLIKDAAARKEMGEAGRRLAAKHDIIVGVGQWKRALEVE